jgi:hypothetical protein
MAEPPDYQDLARRYVALWQDQLLAAASDPALAENLARLLTFAGGFTPWSQVARARTATPGADVCDHDSEAATTEAAGTAAAAAAPHERGDALDRLARRIAALEERLAVLEAGTRRAGDRPRTPGRGRRR